MLKSQSAIYFFGGGGGGRGIQNTCRTRISSNLPRGDLLGVGGNFLQIGLKVNFFHTWMLGIVPIIITKIALFIQTNTWP